MTTPNRRTAAQRRREAVLAKLRYWRRQAGRDEPTPHAVQRLALAFTAARHSGALPSAEEAVIEIARRRGYEARKSGDEGWMLERLTDGLVVEMPFDELQRTVLKLPP